MKLAIMAIKDRAADCYVSPHFQRNTATAIRALRDQLQDPNDPISRHPEDYELWLFGFLNMETGDVEAEDENGNKYEVPEMVARAQDHKPHNAA